MSTIIDPDKSKPCGGDDPPNPPQTIKSFPTPNPSYTVRVICCVLFIFLTEICLAHYIYRLINSEMRSDYLAKRDFRQYFLNEIRSEGGRDEIARILKELGFESSSTTPEVPGSNRRKRSATRHQDFNYNYLSPPLGDEPYVEFVNPEMRREFEARDEVIRRQTGKGAAPGGDSWVWITGSSRIPKKALEEYCKEVHHFCPGSKGAPGIMGPMGPPGTKGDRGDKGLPGIPGRDGMRGMPGVRAEKGERGDNGFPGLDGRDGVPGEPGLDGVPGRNGYDGRDGAKGEPGTPGLNGINGTDGRNGLQGPTGPPGMKGERGIPGPRGRSGKPGTHGTPGKPGISAYMFSKGNRIEDLLIPPSISSSSEPLVVNEGENVKLSCLATGSPTPKITWMRLEKKPIERGAWQELAVSGPTLNFPFIHRDHMGLYLCIADNGIPPQANHTVSLEVYFPPLVRISNQRVGYVEGANATLECETEAFPEPVRYWERSDGKLLEHGNKYKIDNTMEKDRYKFRMKLTITRANWADRNYTYYCVSKNEIQTTKGEFNLYIKDPSKPDFVGNPIIFGKPAPNKTSEEDICGPVVVCRQCADTKEVKCSDVSLVDLISRWEVRKYGDKVHTTGLPTRSIDCVLYVVGKPVYIGTSEEMYNGCWMRDSHPPSDKDIERFWMTQENEPFKLYEFDNKTVFRKHAPSHNYTLKAPFEGNAHVIFNGSFFYHERGTTNVVRQFLIRDKLLEAPIKLQIPLFLKSKSTRLPKLYSGKHNFMDFSVDDNGLWVIFPVPDSNNTAVMKVDLMNHREMQIQYAWNVSIPHHKVGEMFIVCGVLYAVDSVTEQNTRIRFALDLYSNKLLEVTGLNFSNPFRKTTMVGYNHRNRELYTWDKGNQLTYPVRYHDMGNNSTSKEETRMDVMDGPGID